MALTTGLVSYYKMDETTGTTVEDAIGSNNGTASGASITTGKINNCRSFDGSNDYISTTATITNTFSISMWLNFDTISGSLSDTMFTTINSTGRDGCLFHRYYSTNKLQFNGYKGNSYMGSVTSTKSNFVASTWYHIVLTYDEGSVKIYIDGGLDNSGSITDFETNDLALLFGKYYQDTTTNLMNGLMDEVAIYSRVITSTEVSELYNSGNGLQYPFASVNYTNFFRMF